MPVRRRPHRRRPTLDNWYPHRLKVEMLHQNGLAADPLGPDFDYAAAFNAIDRYDVKGHRRYSAMAA